MRSVAMMYNVAVTLLTSSTAQAHAAFHSAGAQDAMDKLVDKIAQKLFDRTLNVKERQVSWAPKAWLRRREDLDSTMLGKPGEEEEGNEEEGNQEEGNQEEGNKEEGNQEGNQEEGNQGEGNQEGDAHMEDGENKEGQKETNEEGGEAYATATDEELKGKLEQDGYQTKGKVVEWLENDEVVIEFPKNMEPLRETVNKEKVQIEEEGEDDDKVSYATAADDEELKGKLEQRGYQTKGKVVEWLENDEVAIEFPKKEEHLRETVNKEKVEIERVNQEEGEEKRDSYATVTDEELKGKLEQEGYQTRGKVVEWLDNDEVVVEFPKNTDPLRETVNKEKVEIEEEEEASYATANDEELKEKLEQGNYTTRGKVAEWLDNDEVIIEFPKKEEGGEPLRETVNREKVEIEEEGDEYDGYGYGEPVEEAPYVTMPLQGDEVAFVLGRAGVTKQKIQQASGAILDIRENNLLKIIGNDQERERAALYVSLIRAHRKIDGKQGGYVYVDFGWSLGSRRDDLSLIDVPPDCRGLISQRVLRKIEEMYGVMLCYAKDKNKTNAALHAHKTRGVEERLCIYGPRQGRRGAELKVMAAIEHKHPGYYIDMNGNLKDTLNQTGDNDGDDWGCSILSPASDELAYYGLGSNGATRKQIATASGCLIEFIGQAVVVCGSDRGRKEAQDYLQWLLQSEGKYKSGESDEYERKRLVSSVVIVHKESLNSVAGENMEDLRRLEQETRTTCFCSEEDWDSIWAWEYMYRRILITGRWRDVEKARDLVERRMTGARYEALNQQRREAPGYPEERGMPQVSSDRPRYDSRERPRRDSRERRSRRDSRERRSRRDSRERTRDRSRG